ncbi:MAG TPA: S-adenosylmethionine decarboxylase [Ktedonobacteraceae bacterium]
MMQQIITQFNVTTDDEMFIKRYQQENPWGLATSVDLYGCNPDAIRSAEKIRAFVDALCKLIDMKKFGPTIVVDFGEDPRVSGYSMTQLIETSLISGHFANQSNAAYLDIFSCKAYPPYVAAAFAKEFFEARDMKVSIHFRY